MLATAPTAIYFVIGEGRDIATLAEGNGDLTAYWYPKTMTRMT